MKIKVLITGGTIDKAYNTSTGELAFVETHIIDMLNRSRSMADTLSEVLFLKDSLEITHDNRALILAKCLESKEDAILVTHGTDTIVETAQLLGENIQDKTIVLFGAMTPYSVNQSDALFNLGFALSSVQTQSAGVYIAMNGKVFNFDKVQKNKSLGIFENT
jgi:L-asparaginase